MVGSDTKTDIGVQLLVASASAASANAASACAASACAIATASGSMQNGW